MPSLSRGMTTPALLFSILSSTLLAIRPASGTAIGLPSEIVSFVPSCATVCLSTFIDANFPQGLCGTEPTFQCLCAHTGTNGFTVGEGALACIASEDNMGQCTGTDASRELAHSSLLSSPKMLSLWHLLTDSPLPQRLPQIRHIPCVTARPVQLRKRTQPLWPHS